MGAAIKPVQLLALGVLRARNTMPYLADALSNLIRRQMTPTMEAELVSLGITPTLCVTETGVMFWSESWVAAQEPVELAFGVAHEVMHLLLGHDKRHKAIEVPVEHFRLANLAKDACINESLTKVFGASVDKDAIYPATLQQPEKWIWEERYHRLLQQLPSKMPKPRVGAGACGGCAGNEQSKEEERRKGEGRSAAQIERIKRAVAGAVKEHVQSKGIGTVPADLARWAEITLTPPKIDWRTKLGRFVRGMMANVAGATDHTWTRISRRQGGIGFGPGKPLVPALHSTRPRVGVVTDTSGSMSVKELTDALVETRGVVLAAGGEIMFAAVDAAVHALQPVRSPQEIVKLLKGGGGTDMRPGIDALVASKMHIGIIMTDGYIPHPGEDPGIKIIWVIVGGNKDFTAPFGEVVVIEREAEAA